MERCPTAAQLERWLQQPGDSAEARALADHVDGCPRCQAALERLTVAPQAVRPEGVGTATSDFPALDALKETPPPVAPGQGRGSSSPGQPPATFRPAGLQPGSASGAARLEQDIGRLLQRRLRIFSLVGVAVFATFEFLAFGGARPVYIRTGNTLGIVLLTAALLSMLGCAVVVWSCRSLSLRTLRVLEILIFGTSAAFFAKHRYTALVHGPEGPWEGPGHRELFLIQITLINNSLWNFAILCYGLVIPNTWRRCVLVVTSLALLAVGVTAWAALEQQAVAERLGFLLSFSVLGLLVSAALAVFGSFKISTLYEEAFAARQLGQYVLKGRLGAGAMGEVYLAEHRLLKRPCAVKIIRPERAGDPHLLRRFEREVQATARLSHYNTVEIYDYGHTEDGTFYYVMEYLPGLSLEELVARHGAQPAARVVHSLRQLCGALREAHEAGLVHRDIKPSNIIACNPGGQYDVVKLVDFGLVRPPDVGTGTRLTKEGLILGTPEFMSPEQAKGQDAVDARSDLYSLGALAYFLLAGRSPFAGKGVLETLLAHLHDPPPPLRGHHPEVGADLEEIVLRCLAKDPAQRFPDAEALERALARCSCVGAWTEAQARSWWQAVRESEAAGSGG